MTQQSPKKSTKRSWKKSAGFMLSFVLFLGLVGLFFSLDLWLGFLNKQTVVTAVADSQYSDRSYEQLREDLEALMKSHELDSDIALAIVDENEFYAASGNRITAALKGETTKVDADTFRGDLADAINSELVNQNLPLTPEIKSSVDEIVFTAGNLYENHANFQFGEQFFNVRHDMMPLVRNLGLLSLAISLVSVIALASLYRRRHAALSLINYALIGAVMANLLVAGLLYVTNPIGETTAALYYQNFIDQYIFQSLVPVSVISLIGLVVAGVLWVAIRRVQKEE
jgi:uncharacterized protein YejL (UPF0352 family)